MHRRRDKTIRPSPPRHTARGTAGDALLRVIAPGRSLPVVTVGLLLIALIATAPLAQAQGCRRSSYIPGFSPLTLQHVNGATIALQRHSRNYRPTAHVWINGTYVGEHEIPFAVAGGEIQVLLHMRQRLETWLGSVRQAYKAVPYVVVCGPWRGTLP
jgi:hypothetical protein